MAQLKHPWVKGTQVFTIKGPINSQNGDDDFFSFDQHYDIIISSAQMNCLWPIGFLRQVVTELCHHRFQPWESWSISAITYYVWWLKKIFPALSLLDCRTVFVLWWRPRKLSELASEPFVLYQYVQIKSGNSCVVGVLSRPFL